MSLSPGARIGPYEIINPIGAGGMGEVYRARDTSLQRDVALKILPDRFAHDPDRLARFQREAHVLASLNHTHIAQIHGVEISGGARVLVMEFVPGDTLDVRLHAARGGLPVPDVLDIGRQIAEALEAAHEQGIVHRDLKPANIKITSDGTVKVLDFGLAKLTDQAEGRRSDASDELSESPTMTSPAMATSAGMLLGTAAYMAPEQARGKPVDKRADIWAFGCVLFELLSGKPAFDGETITDVLSAIVTRNPDWTALPAATPQTLRALVERCLVKDPRQRLRDIGEARIALGHSETERIRATPPPSRRLWPERVAWATAVVAVAISVAALLLFRSEDPASAPGAVQLSIDLPAGVNPTATGSPALSPDATQLAFRGADDIGGAVVWLLNLQTRTPHRLAGTEDASPSLFWSPDGGDLAFFDNLRRLRAVDVASGAIRTICSVPTEIWTPTGTWNADGDILFGGASGVLYRAPAVGGEPSVISKLKPEEVGHGRPSFLPDGRRFVFTVFRKDRRADELWLGSLDDQNLRSFLAPGSFGKFVAPDVLLMFKGSQLFAQRLDVYRGTLIGEAVPVPADIGGYAGGVSYSAVGNVLAFRAITADQGRRFSWHTRTGAATGEIAVPDNAQGVEIAPDGSRAVFEVFEEGLASRDLWLVTLATGATQKVAFTDADEADAKWMPDSRTIVYSPRRDAAGPLVQLALDSTEPPRPLEGFENAELQQYPGSISRNGQILAFMREGRAFWTSLPHSKAEPLPSVGAGQPRPRVSPDGRWFLYEATSTNRREVYLEPLPPTGARWPVSRDGGTWARWHPNGREIYFIDRDYVMMAVTFQAAPTVQISAPVRLFQTAIAPPTRSGVHVNYDVTSDGRFLVVENVGAVERSAPLRVIVNWQSLLPR
jgi:serine/threonine protein kinase/Tol biopolymer transport system component